jgi:hypothetical protein
MTGRMAARASAVCLAAVALLGTGTGGAQGFLLVDVGLPGVPGLEPPDVEIELPDVELPPPPELPAPEPPAPPPLPALPDPPSAPVPSAPEVPEVPAGQAPQASDLAPAAIGSAPATTSQAPAAPGTAAADPDGATVRRTAAGTSPARAPGRPTRGPSGSPKVPRVEQVVVRLRQCLGAVGDVQRRVLVLRAGLGSRPALSPRQVARRLGRDSAQVRRIERRGLRRLRTLARAGACAPADMPAGGSDDLVGDASVGATGGPGASGDAPRGAVKGVTASSPEEGGSGPLVSLPSESGSILLGTLLLALAGAIVLFAVHHEVRRH